MSSRSSARFAKASRRWTADDGAAIAAELGLPAGSSILDVGGGAGVLASFLAAASGCTVTVLDCDSDAVAEASARKGVLAVPGDAADMPLRDATFDAAILIDAFHHLRDQESAVSEIARVVRSGGVVLVAERDPAYFAAKLTFAYERVIGESVTAHEPQELAKIFGQVGIDSRIRRVAGTNSYHFVGIRT